MMLQHIIYSISTIPSWPKIHHILCRIRSVFFFFFFQAEDGIRDLTVTGVQTCALPISLTVATVTVNGYVVTVTLLPCVLIVPLYPFTVTVATVRVISMFAVPFFPPTDRKSVV